MNERIIPTEYKEFRKKLDEVIEKMEKDDKLTDEDYVLIIYEGYIISQNIADKENSDIDNNVLDLIISEAGYNKDELMDTKVVDIFEGLKYLGKEKLMEIFAKVNLLLLFGSNSDELDKLKEEFFELFEKKGE